MSNMARGGMRPHRRIIARRFIGFAQKGSGFAATLSSKGGAAAWDLVGWALDDEDVETRRQAAKCLVL